MVKVAFLGPLGTYSHQAAIQQFSEADSCEYIPVKSIPQCFDRLKNELDIDYAVVPLENSTNGQVVFTYDLLRDWMLESDHAQGNEVLPELEIVAEQYVSIELCLISPVPLDLTDLSKIKIGKLYSHPQVWGQVPNYLESLRKRIGNVEKVDSDSTSGAVGICCENYTVNNDVKDLAIASKTAALVHKAHIVDGPINDKKGNTTRFLVMRRRSTLRPSLNASLENKVAAQRISLLTFLIKQDDPGSLVDVLEVFKMHNINMCSISSRPYHKLKKENSETIPEYTELDASDRKWQYVFFVEFAHAEERDWAKVFKDISSRCLSYCLWGTFFRDGRYYD